MLFILSAAMKSIKKNKGINLLIVFTFFAAYLFLFLGSCYIEDALTDFNIIQNGGDSVFLESSPLNFEEGKDHTIPPQKFDAFFQKYSFVQDFTVVEKRLEENRITGEFTYYYLVQEGFSKHYNFKMLTGRYFYPEELETGAAVCIIEKNFQDISGLQVGDTMAIGKKKLQIIGVMKFNANVGVKIVPYQTIDVQSLGRGSFQGYQIVATLTDMQKKAEIDWTLLGLQAESVTGNELYQANMADYAQRSTFVFVSCGLILIYALSNLINILFSKLDSQRKNLGIRCALGATNKQIFLQFFFECMLLVFAAVFLVFLSEPFISEIVKCYFNHYFGIYTFFFMLLASFVSAFFISLALFRKFHKLKVIEIIRKS